MPNNPEHLEADEMVPLFTEDDYTDEFRAYSDRLQAQMSKLVLEQPEIGESEQPDTDE